jgi:hypothetical protein
MMLLPRLDPMTLLPAGADDDVLLAVDRVGRRRRIEICSAIEAVPTHNYYVTNHVRRLVAPFVREGLGGEGTCHEVRASCKLKRQPLVMLVLNVTGKSQKAG